MVKIITHPSFHVEIGSYLLTVFLIGLEMSFAVWLGSVLEAGGA